MNNENKTESGIVDPKKVRSYFSRIGFGILLMSVAATVVQLVVKLAVEKFAPELFGNIIFVWLFSLVPMYCIGLPILLLCFKGVPTAKPEAYKMKPGQVISAILVSFTIMYIGSYIGNILMAFINSITGNEASNAVGELISRSNLLFVVVATVIIAPLVEEFVFRKLIIDRTRAYGEATSIVFSALLFGLFHGNLYQFFYAFGLGLLLGFIYMRTGRLRYTIILHAVINFFGGVVSTLVTRFVDLEAYTEIMLKISDQEYVGSMLSTEAGREELLAMINPHLLDIAILSIYSLATMVLSIVGLVMLLTNIKKIKLKRSEAQLDREVVGATVYLNVGVVLLIVCMLYLMVWSLM